VAASNVNSINAVVRCWRFFVQCGFALPVFQYNECVILFKNKERWVKNFTFAAILLLNAG
jgi:hypothetical protein